MAAFIFLGWLVGLALGGIAAAMGLMSLGITPPIVLSPLVPFLAPLLSTVSVLVGVLLSFLVLIVAYTIGYAIATAGVATLLPGATGLMPPIFPLAMPVVPATPTPVGAAGGEFFGRGLMIGTSAMVNSVLLALIPYAGVVLASWAFTVISLAAVIFVARNRIFQGFLGWSGWLLPVSHLATGVGLLLFLVNIPFALVTFGLGAFFFDWTTGVVHTAGGLAAIATPPATAGFSLGNFTFVRALPVAGAFTAPSVDSHETGHSLNTAAFGGVVLWINAIDQSILPPRRNLAYGELTAESHAQNFGTTRSRFFSNLWV
jgi:hypothetical protein